MRLLEFQADQIMLKNAISAFDARFKLERVGGQVRVYTVGQELGVVYLVNGGPKAIGLTWQSGSNVLSRVYIWNKFNAAHSPDIVADVPMGSQHEILSALCDMIDHPHRGIVEGAEPAGNPITLGNFIKLARNKYSGNLSRITRQELQDFALSQGVAIPPAILAPPFMDDGTLDLDTSGKSDERFYLTAKAAQGTHFEVPGATKTQHQIDQAFADENGSPETMEQQYEELKEKVKLVASNRSNYIKSLLITGAPSSGKTFTVMETIKELGLKEGSDYIVVKGSITDAALYTTFIEQIDDLTIFDDCDSVCETKDGKNMLKNALDTYAVRDIGRPNANSTNTKHMPTDERQQFVDAISRILRGSPAPGDLDRFESFVPKKAKPTTTPKVVDYDDSAPVFGLPDPYKYLASLNDENSTDDERLVELQNYFKRRPPNRIDFKGRIIFISNMDESEWDSAILTRAFRQNMNFADDEMLAFIVKIKSNIAAPGLTDAQKDEVLAYLSELHESGQLKSRMNFRLVQQCFDLRLCGPWKRMVAAL